MALIAPSHRTKDFEFTWEGRTFKKNYVKNCKCPREKKIAINTIYFVVRGFSYGQSILVLVTMTISIMQIMFYRLFLWETRGLFPLSETLGQLPSTRWGKISKLLHDQHRGNHEELEKKANAAQNGGGDFPYFSIFLKGSVKVKFLLHFPFSGPKLHGLSELISRKPRKRKEDLQVCICSSALSTRNSRLSVNSSQFFLIFLPLGRSITTPI